MRTSSSWSNSAPRCLPKTADRENGTASVAKPPPPPDPSPRRPGRTGVWPPTGEAFLPTREITTHKVNGCNGALTITVLDEPGSGGANHLYKITGFNSVTNASDPWVAAHGAPAVHSHVLFQNGPIGEVGTNGVTHEALLAIVIDRLQSFQDGPYTCEDNQEAMLHLDMALCALQRRTLARVARGVEGTHAK